MNKMHDNFTSVCEYLLTIPGILLFPWAFWVLLPVIREINL